MGGGGSSGGTSDARALPLPGTSSQTPPPLPGAATPLAPLLIYPLTSSVECLDGTVTVDIDLRARIQPASGHTITLFLGQDRLDLVITDIFHDPLLPTGRTSLLLALPEIGSRTAAPLRFNDLMRDLQADPERNGIVHFHLPAE